MVYAEWGGSLLSARLNLVKTTEQQNNKTTNNKTTNNKTTEQQNNRTTKQYLRGKIVMYLFRPDETDEN